MAEMTLSMIRESLHTGVIADALDTLGYRNQSPRVRFQSFCGTARLAGRCRTTVWEEVYQKDPQPYALELRAVDSCGADDVVVCAAQGSLYSALWGELLSTAAQRVGCAGALVDGAVRDVAQIEAMGFPVYARGTSVYDSQNRQRVVEIDVPVQIAGVRICPGDLVVADRDGAVVVPQGITAAVLRAAWEKAHAEKRTRDAIRNGMSATEAYERFGVL